MMRCRGVDIDITIVEVRGDKVRIAFDAPEEVAIFRSELVDGSASVRVQPVRDSAASHSKRMSTRAKSRGKE